MKRLGIFMVAFWAVALLGFAQEINTPAAKLDTVIKYPAEPIDDIHCGEIRDYYDEITAFQEAFTEWLSQHLQYPEDCQQKNIEGLVLVSLKVDKDGFIRDVKVVRSPHPSLSKEAVRVVKSMPKFDSIQQVGRFGLKIVHPIMFRLNNQETKSAEHRKKSKKIRKSRNRE